jgi:hypothetical protein
VSTTPINAFVFRDGDPLTITGIIFETHVAPRFQSQFVLPMVEKSHPFHVRVQLSWEEELADRWWSFRAMLTDETGAVLGGEKPGLFYNGPTDCPTVIRFPVARTRMQDPLYGGILSLGMRAADRYRREDVATVEDH